MFFSVVEELHELTEKISRISEFEFLERKLRRICGPAQGIGYENKTVEQLLLCLAQEQSRSEITSAIAECETSLIHNKYDSFQWITELWGLLRLAQQEISVGQRNDFIRNYLRNELCKECNYQDFDKIVLSLILNGNANRVLPPLLKFAIWVSSRSGSSQLIEWINLHSPDLSQVEYYKEKVNNPRFFKLLIEAGVSYPESGHYWVVESSRGKIPDRKYSGKCLPGKMEKGSKSLPDWKERIKEFLAEKIEELEHEARGIFVQFYLRKADLFWDVDQWPLKAPNRKVGDRYPIVVRWGERKELYKELWEKNGNQALITCGDPLCVESDFAETETIRNFAINGGFGGRVFFDFVPLLEAPATEAPCALDDLLEGGMCVGVWLRNTFVNENTVNDFKEFVERVFRNKSFLEIPYEILKMRQGDAKVNSHIRENTTLFWDNPQESYPILNWLQEPEERINHGG